MRTDSGGYVLVLADRRSAWAGVRVLVSCVDGAAWLARAQAFIRRGRRLPPRLRLISSDYVDDPGRVRAQLAERLGPRFADRGRAGRGRLRKVLAEVLAEDRVRLESRFDSETGLFRTPGDTLSGPAKRLVARLRSEIVARTPGRQRMLGVQFLRPYGAGLLWPLLSRQLGEAGLPEVYRAETYRALARSLAGRQFTDGEMVELRAAVSGKDAEYRLGAWEFGRFPGPGRAGRPAGKPASAPAVPGLERFVFYLLNPRDHMLRGFADYKRRVHGALPVLLAILAFRLLQVAALGGVSAVVAWLMLRVEGGLMPGLTLLFAAGAAVLAGRLYRRPDMARLLGHVGEQELSRLREALEGVHPHTLEPVRPAAPSPAAPPEPARPVAAPEPAATPEPARPAAASESAAAAAKSESPRQPVTAQELVRTMMAAGAPEESAPHPVDIPAPVPAPPAHKPASPAPPAAEAPDPARAFLAGPLGAFPFPIPCDPEDEKPGPEAPASQAPQRESAASGARDEEAAEEAALGVAESFALGWGISDMMPNWMAASLPEAEESAKNAPAKPPADTLSLDWGMFPPVPNWMAASIAESEEAADETPAAKPAGAGTPAGAESPDEAMKKAKVFHAASLPPALPSAAFWGVEGAGLHPGSDGSGPDEGNGPRRGDS